MVTSVFKTIDVLKKYGYMKEGPYFDSGKYKDDFLQISACVGLNLNLKSFFFGTDCVTITGFYKTERTHAYIEFDMPSEFEIERSALVWFLVTLERRLGKREWENYCRYKTPPIKITKVDNFIFPWVIKQKEDRKENILKLKKIVDAVHFSISRKELGRLRSFINKNNNTEIVHEVEAKVNFDGEVVTWKTSDFKFAGIATGIEWPNAIMITYSNKWGFPPKFWGEDHSLSFSEEGLFVDYSLNSEIKVSGNTVGEIDIFEAEILSRLLEFAYFYPKYDGEVDTEFDEQDFSDWIIMELGSEFYPYLDCLVSMVRVAPLYKDDVSVGIVKPAIDVFKDFPNGTDTRSIHTALEKKCIFVDEIMFNRVLAGWKCWYNRESLGKTY